MSDTKYSCQGCERTDLTLTRNGKVRSHAADGKRASEDNPACGMGSEYPKESTEHHRHHFRYGDDGHGHSGSVCECGMEEPDAPAEPAPPVPPNPFRDPLPGGVFDSLPHDRRTPQSLGMGSGPADLSTREPYALKSADDFLDGSDDDYAEEADDGGPSYWPARYDGECGTCFAHFNEGDMIRRVDDGYEAQQCCGYGAQPQPDRPKSVARTLPVVRGRYRLPDPETGLPISASRASKYAEGIADSYALDQWRHRMILVGVVNDPEILDKVASALRDKDPLAVVKSERAFLNKRAEDAMSAAGGDRRSAAGTTLHKYTEEVDAGTRELEDVPEEFRPDARAYRLALAECGFRPVKGLIERSVFCRDLEVCGTFDRVLECVRTTEVLDLEGRKITIRAGEFVIGDVKSGDNIEHPWLEILIQEAIYANAINENGVAVQDEPGGPFRWAVLADFGVDHVREDVGVVMHVPYGSGECSFYAADLITGWRGAQICKSNRDFWKIKLPKVPIASFAVTDEDHAPGSDDQEVCPGCGHGEHAGECDCGCFNGAEEPPVAGYDEEFGYRCACGQAWDNVEIANAYDHDTHECGPADPVVAAMAKEAVHRAKHAAREEPSRDVEWWERAFRSVTTREGANACWREAKDARIPADEIKRLVSLVSLDPKPQTAVSGPGSSRSDEPVAETGGSRPPAAQRQDGPSLTVRAHAVTTKAEASAVFKAINNKIGTLPEEERPAARDYRDRLVGIMKERLAGRSS